jgi:hypothetical protein
MNEIEQARTYLRQAEAQKGRFSTLAIASALIAIAEGVSELVTLARELRAQQKGKGE